MRFACLVADWPPSLLATLLTANADLEGPLLQAYEFRPADNNVGVVRPDFYERFLEGKGGISPESITMLPSNHFVWSNDLVAAFSDLIDRTVGRDDAHSQRLRIVWNPGLLGCDTAVDESPDMKALGATTAPKNQIKVTGNICAITFEGTTAHLKNSKGLRYIAALLRRPGAEIQCTALYNDVNPVPPERLAQNTTDSEVGSMDDELDLDSESIDAPYDEPSPYNIKPSQQGTNVNDAIDPQAKSEITARIRAIKELLEDARERGGEAKRQALEDEQGKLLKYLGAHINFKGRPRKINNDSERFRKAISNACYRLRKSVTKWR